MEKKGIEEVFSQAVIDWKAHCNNLEIQISSNQSKRTDCQAYRKIIGLGKDALPLVYEILTRKDYDTYFPIFGWVSVLYEITDGRYKVPDNLSGQVLNIIDHATNWLEKNLNNH